MAYGWWSRAAVATLVVLSLSCARVYRPTLEEAAISSPWPFYRGDLASRGYVNSGKFNGELDIVWQHEEADKPAGPLTIYGGSLVYPGTRNRIRFYDCRSGKERGFVNSRGAAQTGVVIYDSLAIFATAPPKSWLRCLNLYTGQQKWKRRVKDAAAGSIIVDGKLIVGTTDGRLSAYRIADGNSVWVFEAKSGLVASPGFENGRIIQATDGGRLYAVQSSDGTQTLQAAVRGPVVGVGVADMIYATDMTGYVYAIDPSSGQVVWETHAGGPVWTSPAVTTERVIVGDSGGRLTALDSRTGAVLWQFDTGDVVKASPIVVGEYVIVGTLSGKLFSLTALDGRLVEQKEFDGAIAVSPVSDGDRVYIASEKGTIAALGTSHE
ncbi:MAG TPA: PQQ-binding-like beta-propeller repeat protein [Candidatus Deferrimicrobium sp.]|nr:PQQ-binding-like beta-propeller repeat protein [Candidatus Deferrimicrobium sp.]